MGAGKRSQGVNGSREEESGGDAGVRALNRGRHTGNFWTNYCNVRAKLILIGN